MKKPFFKRLSLLDLLAVTVAGGIFSAILYLRYDNFSCKSMQSEAKFYLNEIYAAQKIYFAEHGCYAKLSDLEKEKRVVLPNAYYDYFDEIVPDSSFLVKAVGKKEFLVDLDTWQIDENKRILNVMNKCMTKK